VEFVRIHDMTVWVRRAKSAHGVIPSWYGGSLPLSAEVTEAVRNRLDQANNGIYAGAEMQAVRPILELQAKWSRIPARDELLIERTKTRDGYHIFVFPFAGRLVHEGLAALLAYRLSRIQSTTFSLSANDYGFEMLAQDAVQLGDDLPALFTREALVEDILNSLNASEMAKRQFREIARVAGLIFERFPGGQKTTRQLQASSGLIYDVFAKYDPSNLLLEQARREVLERQLESTRLVATLERIQAGRIVLMETRRPTPFAFPLIIERVRGLVTSETLQDRIRKMLATLEKAAGEA
jgi:ATP-dependent Lhr-like helicase